MQTSSEKPQGLVFWRLFALVYDFFPVLALWMVVSLLFNFGYFIAGHVGREYIHPISPLAALLWLVCWLVAGAYAVISWHRGGRTLGMRPWRLRVVSADGGNAPTSALLRRYVVGTISLLLAGLGFWWAWFDRDRLTWHDRASGTRMIREPKRKKP